MSSNRIFGEVSVPTDLVALVEAARPTPMAGSFVACPCFAGIPGAMSGSWVQEAYRRAYEQAVALTQPPRHERLYRVSSN